MNLLSPIPSVPQSRCVCMCAHARDGMLNDARQMRREGGGGGWEGRVDQLKSCLGLQTQACMRRTIVQDPSPLEGQALSDLASILAELLNVCRVIAGYVLHQCLCCVCSCRFSGTITSSMRIYKESNMIEARHRMLTDNYCGVRFFHMRPILAPQLNSTTQGCSSCCVCGIGNSFRLAWDCLQMHH